MGQGGAQLVFLAFMVLVFYFLLIRPQQRRARAQQTLQRSLELGDEIQTIGGFVGTVKRFDGDVVTIELSPGVEARILRRAIAGRHAPAAATPADDVTDEPADDVTEELEPDVRQERDER